MRRKLLATAMALTMLLSPALAEEAEIAALEARIAELEAENAELRELLSQEESARLLAARFDGGVITVSEAKAEYDYLAYSYEQLGMDPDDHADTIKNEVLNNLTEDAILTLKARELGVYEPSAEEEADIRARAQASLDEMVDYYLAYQADPNKSDEENRAAVLEFLAGAGTTLESLAESMTSQGWRDRLFAAVTADVPVTTRPSPTPRWPTPPTRRVTRPTASAATPCSGTRRATAASSACSSPSAPKTRRACRN